jgi:nucleoside-diphosphate-sugar epimerase
MLVTGATGFIGGRLCERLVEAGAEVHALSRRDSTDSQHESIRWHKADLTDADAALELVETVAPDTVFHLAAEVFGDPGPDQVRPMLESNLFGTINLLTAVQKQGSRRMVLAGTVVEPRGEEAPTSPYAAAKAASTAHARMFHALYGTPVVCLRLAMVYGPGQPDSSKLIPHVIDSLLSGDSPQLSSGLWEVDWVYIDDVVDALVLAALTEGVEGETLDVGSGDVASVRTVVEHLSELVDGSARPTFGATADRPLARSVSRDLEPTRALLGWSAETPLSEGLRQTVAWHSMRIPSVICFLGASSLPF